MDLSGIIFVALAAGWALYLIPKALQQHDELARSRSVEDFSHRVRVLGRGLAGRGADVDPGQRDSDRSSDPGSVADPAPATPAADEVPEPVEGRPHPDAPYRVTRAAARRAASRRRRVLLVLLLALAGTAAAAWLAYLPWWSVAVPGGLIVAFLVIARLSVRREEKRRRPRSVVPERRAPRPAAEEVAEPADREDTVGVAVDDLAAIQEEPLPDDGALWDPLPLNLPTYVGKPHARRTVRTIELTGVTSSGHDAADTALARRADAEHAQQAQQSVETVETAETGQRRAVGE